MKNSFILLVVIALLTIACKQKPSDSRKNEPFFGLNLPDVDFSATFDSCETDTIPSGWFQAVTGNNEQGHWEVIPGFENKQVGQVSTAGSGYLFNLLISEQQIAKDLILSVDMKAISGNEDQGGGLVWRYQNNENYYIARANPLESNFRLYKVTNGNRKKLENYSLPVTAGIWHKIVISHSSDTIKCFFDGQLFLQRIDSTINKPGLAGLWTKADAVTFFDNFQLKNLDNQ
jgi:hypothetical protein